MSRKNAKNVKKKTIKKDGNKGKIDESKNTPVLYKREFLLAKIFQEEITRSLEKDEPEDVVVLPLLQRINYVETTMWYLAFLVLLGILYFIGMWLSEMVINIV